VVRGGLAAADSIRRTAEVSMARHGFYGVSVFLAWGMTVDELVQRTAELSPERSKQLRTSTVAAVRGGCPIWRRLERSAAFGALPVIRGHRPVQSTYLLGYGNVNLRDGRPTVG
jgi:hypothetical protein